MVMEMMLQQSWTANGIVWSITDRKEFLRPYNGMAEDR